MNAQALITGRDVQASGRWSQAVLGATVLEPLNPYAGRYGDLGPGVAP